MEISSINDNNLSLSDRAADQILRYIHENQLSEGDQLPVEVDLMDRLNVSRSTVREAIRTLSSRNIVVVKRGSGTYVSHAVVDDIFGLKFKQDRYKLLSDLFELRMILEPQIAIICVEKASEEEIDDVWKLHKQVEQCIRHGKEYTESDVQFHCKIAEYTHNDIFKILLPEITKGISIFIEYVGDALLKETIEAHKMIAQAIMNRDRQGSFDAIYQHLKQEHDCFNRIFYDKAVMEK